MVKRTFVPLEKANIVHRGKITEKHKMGKTIFSVRFDFNPIRKTSVAMGHVLCP